MEGEAGDAGRTRHVSLVRGLGFMSGVQGPAEGFFGIKHVCVSHKDLVSTSFNAAWRTDWREHCLVKAQMDAWNRGCAVREKLGPTRQRAPGRTWTDALGSNWSNGAGHRGMEELWRHPREMFPDTWERSTLALECTS